MGRSMGITLPVGWTRFYDVKHGDTVELVVDKDIKITLRKGDVE